jgi:hypothetical protein
VKAIRQARLSQTANDRSNHFTSSIVFGRLCKVFLAIRDKTKKFKKSMIIVMARQ